MFVIVIGVICLLLWIVVAGIPMFGIGFEQMKQGEKTQGIIWMSFAVLSLILLICWFAFER